MLFVLSFGTILLVRSTELVDKSLSVLLFSSTQMEKTLQQDRVEKFEVERREFERQQRLMREQAEQSEVGLVTPS